MSFRITVQICSYNRKDLLKRSLDALFKVNFPPDEYEVIVIDDGSPDGTTEMLKTIEAPCRFRHFYQEKAGLAKGRNIGIRNAEGEVILFIDDDIIADPELLNAHWALHEQDRKTIVMGWVNHVDSLEGKLTPKFTMADISTSYFWTSNVSVRREYLLEVGLFDEEFTEYGWEDLELGLRLKERGLVRKFNPKALVYHYKSKWRAADLPKLLKQAEAKGRTAIIFLHKKPTLRVRLATGILAPRLWLNELLKLGSGFCRNAVDKAGDEPLKGIALSCARQLVTIRYFDTIKAGLASGNGS